MRACAALVVVGLLCACSSNPGVESAPAPQTVRVLGSGGGDLRITPVSDPNVILVTSSIDKVWGVLPPAYDSVGLSVDMPHSDAKAHMITNGGVKMRRQLGRSPLSKYIDCGGTQIGASADSYEIILTVTTHLRAAESGATAISTVLEAAGKPVQFQQAYMNCKSTGRLEKLIGEVVRAKLK